jgi:hypothetical protein
MKTSEKIDLIAAALSRFQGQLQNVKETAENPFFRSHYAPISVIWDEIRPLLAENGLAIIQNPCSIKEEKLVRVSVSTLCIHTSGQWIESDPLEMCPDKITPQGIGSTVTYACRYSLKAFVGLASEDDDGEGAEDRNKKTPPQKKAKKETTQSVGEHIAKAVKEKRETETQEHLERDCEFAVWLLERFPTDEIKEKDIVGKYRKKGKATQEIKLWLQQWVMTCEIPPPTSEERIDWTGKMEAEMNRQFAAALQNENWPECYSVAFRHVIYKKEE